MVYYPLFAVRKGRKPGIYQNWSEVQEQIKGFEGAQYQGFHHYVECQEFIDQCKYPWGFATAIGSLARDKGVKFVKPGTYEDMVLLPHQFYYDRDPPNPERARAKLLEHFEKMSKRKHHPENSMKDMKKFFVNPKK